MNLRRGIHVFLLLAAGVTVPATLSSCLAAAGAAGGGGFYFTNRGIEGVLEGTVDEISRATSAAFEALSVEGTGERMTNGEGEKEVYGEAGDDDVTVRLERETATSTRVEVRVRTSAVTWDKEMAERILDTIQANL